MLRSSLSEIPTRRHVHSVRRMRHFDNGSRRTLGLVYIISYHDRIQLYLNHLPTWSAAVPNKFDDGKGKFGVTKVNVCEMSFNANNRCIMLQHNPFPSQAGSIRQIRRQSPQCWDGFIQGKSGETDICDVFII